MRPVFLGVMCVGGSFLYGALDQDSVSGVVPQEVVIDGTLHSAFGAIPAEIRDKIFSGLGKRDIKSVKETCKDFNGSAKYRWNEVRGYIDFPEGYTVEQVAPRLFRCLARVRSENGMRICNEESDSIGGFVCHCLISGCKNFKRSEGIKSLGDHLAGVTSRCHADNQHKFLEIVGKSNGNWIGVWKEAKDYFGTYKMRPIVSELAEPSVTPNKILFVVLLEQQLKRAVERYFERLQEIKVDKAHKKNIKARVQEEQEAEAREEEEEEELGNQINRAWRLKNEREHAKKIKQLEELRKRLPKNKRKSQLRLSCNSVQRVEDILKEDEVDIDHDFVCDDLPVDRQAERFVVSVLGDEELLEWYVEDDARETKCVTACGQHKRTADSFLSELDRLQEYMGQAEEWALKRASKDHV